MREHHRLKYLINIPPISNKYYSQYDYHLLKGYYPIFFILNYVIP